MLFIYERKLHFTVKIHRNRGVNMIVITGATGNVGSKLTDILLNSGQKLRLIARHREKLEPYSERGAEIATGSLVDTSFLTETYTGAKAVFTMLPADFTAPDITAYQDKAGGSVFTAVRDSGVKYVVNLSSLGGHTPVGVGIVAGLAKLEVKLNGLKEVNILHLRSGYFMENLLGSIGMIKNMGVVGGPIKHDVSMSLIATQDIAQVAAEKLMKLDFSGHSVLPLMGPRNYTMDEVWTVLSAAIGKPDLRYAQFPAAQVKEGLMQMMGVSESVADSFIGLSEGMNNGLLNVEKRIPATTTPTTIEEFAKLFADVYKGG
jgi:uncharacterized protein YbjT (DUF2867 family)